MSFILNFVGDTCISGSFAKNLEAKKQLFPNSITNIFQQSDLTIANLEGPETQLTNHLRPDVDTRQAPGSIHYLSQNGITCFNLANNHLFDCNEKGFFETKKTLETYHLKFFGAGTEKEASDPIIIKKNDISVAMYALSHKEGLIANNKKTGICSDKHLSRIKKNIKAIRKKVDWIIINYHGGEEYTQFPNPKRRKKLHSFLNFADIVIAHHSHSFQGVEIINNKAIFYSLGNFIFDIPNHNAYPWTNRTAILKLKLQKTTFSYDLIPILIKKKDGALSLGSKHFHKQIRLISKISYFAWLKSCYKVIFKKKVISTQRFSANQNQTIIQKITRLIYKAYNLLVKRRDYRPVFIGAWIYKCLVKTGVLK